MKLPVLVTVLALTPLMPAPAGADVPRIVDIRVGQHEDHERVVIELERRVEARWYVALDGALVLDFAARPLLDEQTLTPGQARIGSILLMSTPEGARLSIDAGEHRARAFELEDPPRLVLDVAAPGPGPLAMPAAVRSVPRCHGKCGPRPFAAAPPAAPRSRAADGPAGAAAQTAATAASTSVPAANPASRVAPQPGPAFEPAGSGAPEPAAPAPADDDGVMDLEGLDRAADVAALAVLPRAPAPRSPLRALLIPLLTGAGLLLIALGGLSLAGVQRRRPRALPAEAAPALEPPASTEVDRMTLLERRLEEELASRRLLEGQLAHAAREIAGLRTRAPDAAAGDAD